MRTKVSRSEEAGSVWMERGGKEGPERSVGVTAMLVRGNRHHSFSVLGEKANRSSAGGKDRGTVTTATTTTIIITAPVATVS